MNIFELASRKSLRYSTSKGQLSVDNLWQLPLVGGSLNLDNIAVELHKEIEQTTTTSFVNRVSNPELDDNKLRMEIVLHVIKSKQDEQDAKVAKKAIESEKAKLQSLIDSKKDEALSSLSIEELEKRISEIG